MKEISGMANSHYLSYLWKNQLEQRKDLRNVLKNVWFFSVRAACEQTREVQLHFDGTVPKKLFFGISTLFPKV